MTPAEVLAAHQLDYGFGTCTAPECDWEHKAASDPDLPPPDRDPDLGALHAAHVLDALTKAGHVLVTLPEPDVDNGRQKVWTSSIGDVIVGKYMGVLIDWTDNDDSPTPGELRAHAAAALAAAAETGGKA